MRLIDADKFEEFIRQNCSDSLVDLWCELVRRQPTIEAVPVVHGEWVPHNRMVRSPLVMNYACSVCGKDGKQTSFCPNCGAKMKGGAE